MPEGQQGGQRGWSYVSREEGREGGVRETAGGWAGGRRAWGTSQGL